MARGKYAARSANRLANLDNELLQDKLGAIAERDAEIRELRRQLERRQSEVDAAVVHRADELAGKQIAAMKSQIDRERQQHQERGEAVAKWLAGYLGKLGRMHPDLATMPPEVENVLAMLAAPAKVGEYMAMIFNEAGSAGWNNRQARRLTHDKIKHNKTVNQAQSLNPDIRRREKLLRANAKAKRVNVGDLVLDAGETLPDE